MGGSIVLLLSACHYHILSTVYKSQLVDMLAHLRQMTWMLFLKGTFCKLLLSWDTCLVGSVTLAGVNQPRWQVGGWRGFFSLFICNFSRKWKHFLCPAAGGSVGREHYQFIMYTVKMMQSCPLQSHWGTFENTSLCFWHEPKWYKNIVFDFWKVMNTTFPYLNISVNLKLFYLALSLHTK